jgi:hypothetical protein
MEKQICHMLKSDKKVDIWVNGNPLLGIPSSLGKCGITFQITDEETEF